MNVSNGQRTNDVAQAAGQRANEAAPTAAATPSTDAEKPWTLRAGANVLSFWNALLKTVAVGFLFGHFWCLASAIYLLLRKSVDEAELDEIYVPDEKRSFDLPTLDTHVQSSSQESDPSEPNPNPNPKPEPVDESESNEPAPEASATSNPNDESGPQIDTDPD